MIGAAANFAIGDLPRPKTAWAGFPGAYSGKCSKAGGASVLQVKPLHGAHPFTPTPDATWGLHLTDANIALGQLANLVRAADSQLTTRVETPSFRLWGPHPIGRLADA